MHLTQKLISLRKQHGLSQLDLAEKLNVSRQAISRWEVGSSVPNTDNLKFLSELYGVPVDYLLHDSAELPGEPAGPRDAPPAEQPSKAPPRVHSKQTAVLFLLGIVLAFLIGFALCMALNSSEEVHTNPEDNLYIETKSQPDETFCFE